MNRVIFKAPYASCVDRMILVGVGIPIYIIGSARAGGRYSYLSDIVFSTMK